MGIIDVIVGFLVGDKRNAIEKALEKDQEYQKAVRAADEAYLKAKKVTDKMLKKYGID